MSWIADHDELSAAFDQVKAPASNFMDQDVSANFPLDIMNGSPNDAPLANRLGGKKIVKPSLRQQRGTEHLHGQIFLQVK